MRTNSFIVMALLLGVVSAQANCQKLVDPAKLAAMKATDPAWPMHNIDNTLWNHNSLSAGDVNRDGFTDYAIIHEGPAKFTFVLHPGSGGDIKKPWRKVILGESPNPEYSDFGDFDGDGNLDIVGASGKRSNATGGSSGINILWGPETRRVCDSASWVDGGLIPETKDRGHLLYVRSRDVNGDGRLDIVGMLIHDEMGNLPADEASVFWMEWRGEKPRAGNWITHVVKWSDGVNTGRKYQGEKWDHCRFTDMDADGDLDIVGNCEEHYTGDRSKRTTNVGVVWFENPGS